MVLQLAEVAVTRALFADIQRRIDVAAATVAARSRHEDRER
jgi:hypothetical protein